MSFCENRGWTVAEYFEKMSSEEELLWKGFHRMYPLPQAREDIKHALALQVIAATGMSPQLLKPEQALPPWFFVLTKEQQRLKDQNINKAKAINARIKAKMAQDELNRRKH